MQRVTNCILYHQDRVLLLKKPRRGWWYAPGGKMESPETILESVKREVKEETNLSIPTATLKGIFTIVIEEDGKRIDEWMMFTFLAEHWEGTPFTETDEGELKWHSVEQIDYLPMPEGDRLTIKKILAGSGTLIGRFTYTSQFELIHFDLSSESLEDSEP